MAPFALNVNSVCIRRSGKKSHRIFTRILYGLKYVTVSSRLPTELNARHLAFICLCVVIVGVLSLYTSGDLAFVISLRSC